MDIAVAAGFSTLREIQKSTIWQCLLLGLPSSGISIKKRGGRRAHSSNSHNRKE